MDVNDIVYDDLPNNEEQLLQKVAKLEAEVKALEAHIQSLETDIQKLCANIIEMKRIRNNLEKNISELYKTAKAEIDRKDRIINELRTQLDQYTSQRRPSVTSFKRGRDSTDSRELSYESDLKKVKRKHEDNYIRSKCDPGSYKRRSRSRSREKHKPVFRNKSKDRCRREQRISSSENHEEKLYEHNAKAIFHGDNSQKKKTSVTEHERDSYKNSNNGSKSADLKNSKESSKITVVKIVSSNGNTIIEKKFNSINKIIHLKGTSKKCLGENDKVEDITNKANLKKSIINREEKREISQKEQDFQQKVNNIQKNLQSVNKLQKTSKQDIATGKYDALPVSINVTHLSNITTMPEACSEQSSNSQSANKVEYKNSVQDETVDTTKMKAIQCVLPTKKQDKIALNCGSDSGKDSFTKEKTMKKVHDLGSNGKGIKKGNKTKIDTLRIEDVTQKLQKRLVSNKKNETIISSTSTESPSVLKESLSKSFLEVVKTAAFNKKDMVDSSKDSVNLTKNVSSEERVEVNSSNELNANNDTVENNTVIEGIVTKQEKLQLPDQVMDTQLPDQAVNTQLPDQVVDTQLPDQAVNIQLPDQAVNTQLPDQVINTQLPDQAVDTQLPDQVVDTQLPDQVVDTQVELVSQSLIGVKQSVLRKEELKTSNTSGLDEEHNKLEVNSNQSQNDKPMKLHSVCKNATKADQNIPIKKHSQKSEICRDVKKTKAEVTLNKHKNQQSQAKSSKNKKVPTIDKEIILHMEEKHEKKSVCAVDEPRKQFHNEKKEAVIISETQCDPADIRHEASGQNLIVSTVDKGDETLLKNDRKDPKSKKVKHTALHKESKEKLSSGNKKDKVEDEIRESDRVLRSASRRNSSKEKLDKSGDVILENHNQNISNQSLKPSTNNSPSESTVNLTHEGEIPVLHLSDCSSYALNNSLFDMNLSIHNFPPAITSSPLKKDERMAILKEDLNISVDTCADKVANNISNISSISENMLNSSSECKISNSSSRKRRRVICTLTD